MGDAPDGNGAATPDAGRLRCVVLAGRGTGRPDLLLAGLARRFANVKVVSDTPSAMVELASPGRKALIVTEPQTIGRLTELLGAVRKYYPTAACWQYRAEGKDGKPELISYEAPSAHAQPTETPEPRLTIGANANAAANVAAASPLAPAEPTPSQEKPSEQEEMPGPAPLVSPEELEMLLGPIPDGPMPEDEAPPQATKPALEDAPAAKRDKSPIARLRPFRKPPEPRR